jgi:hypothetical protein
MHLSAYLGLISHAEQELARAFREVAETHGKEPDIFTLYHTFARQCDRHVEQLQPFVDRYGEQYQDEPDRLHSDLFRGTRAGGLALLRDLHDLYLMATEADISWTVIKQAAQGLQDRELVSVVETCESDTTQQLHAIKTRMKQAAPQTLIVAS